MKEIKNTIALALCNHVIVKRFLNPDIFFFHMEKGCRVLCLIKLAVTIHWIKYNCVDRHFVIIYHLTHLHKSDTKNYLHVQTICGDRSY